MTAKAKAAIIGSGNIGTDLMFKILRLSEVLEVAALIGIDTNSDGLARASRLGVPITTGGIDGFLEMPEFEDTKVVFDATSAKAHLENAKKLTPYDKLLVDLTPAAIGPFVVPAVNLADHVDAGTRIVNMVTCGGQATIPMVAAVAAVTPVHYAEIVASIASRSAGPGTRANIDEFTETTSRAIELVGGAAKGKAIIVLNPAEPPLIMRDTVFCLTGDADQDAIRRSVAAMAARVAQYVPGYRLKQEVQFSRIGADEPYHTLLCAGSNAVTTKVSIFLEVEGAAHYLPAYAGNLDIMTSAALQTAEAMTLRTPVATIDGSGDQ
ncbi:MULTISPECIES: acetaldehyde dehydrogenase (acetylating) [Mycobacteriaceae]|uniref:Acetaldehyde dehydrogenase n=1 Tax=Mycolicibacterium neoaurum VKM Ac-1815D TaxID=700508 RepID=V5XCI8_MYCNE|nr:MULTISPECIES: acetaldehyde dehydrogenase (acetylating) [Mycobacteriaceae]AMO06532.1 acetaldehyde dehydrogenase [Mycolicibacterium neoaurum]AXK75114.1 acetaldehyde dehydrogenase (acetylating) [Mycolicibacterium neoaurum]KUM07897.1 acetaldehyde dehydrogenase (acetylating) [Mycolicibacterium neoaurum]